MIVTLATLRAAGLTEAQILRVVEAVDNERVAAKREQNRKASQKHRAHQKNAADAADAADAHVLTSLPNQEKKEGRKKAHALSAQWMLTEADRNFATTRSWPQARIDIEEQRFRDYWLANGKAKADWAATWRSWVTSPYQTSGGQSGSGQGRPAPKDDPKSIRGAFDRLFEKLNGGDEDGELSRQAHLRLISGGSGERS